MSKTRKSLARQSRREQRRASFDEVHVNPTEKEITRIPVRKAKKRIEPLNAAQENYQRAIWQSDIVFGIGPAGTGKTYLAASMAAEALIDREIDRIVLVRPVVEAAGEKLGFLPGEMDEKYDPYLAPFLDVFEERLGTGHLDYLRKTKIIDARPMAYMRGASFRNTWVLADEMQNATAAQMEMLLTRIGEGSKFIISGDPRQSDLGHSSGLSDAVHRLSGIAGVQSVKFGIEDIVRSGLCQEIVKAYQRH